MPTAQSVDPTHAMKPHEWGSRDLWRVGIQYGDSGPNAGRNDGSRVVGILDWSPVRGSAWYWRCRLR
jgi:hypothetical protein